MNTRQTCTCTCCGRADDGRQWWSLGNYHGLSGLFCADCFDLVRHDAWDQPVNPEGLTLARIRLS